MKPLAIAFLTLTLAAAGLAGAGETNPNALQTPAGPVSLHIIHHASFVMRWNGQTLYVDPTGPAAQYADLGKPDLILITHAHHDHLSPETLAGLDTAGATVVMPPSVADKIGDEYGREQLILGNGDDAERHGITIHAMPMYNLPPSDDAYHPKGWGDGYVLTLGGKRVYISGDTGGIPEMRSLKNIDLAFLCMNLPYTMDVAHAADAVLAFRPAVVYPYHYRGQDVRQFKRIIDQADAGIEVRLRDWYPE